MVKYRVYFKPSAEKELACLPRNVGETAISKINDLLENPRTRGTKKLKGEDSYRLRIGNYRIIYSIDDMNKTITIFRIRHRKEIYRNL